MEYLNSKFSNTKLCTIAIYFIVHSLVSCSNKYDKKIYGKYVNDDTIRVAFSEINLYENNMYSFYSSTCFYNTKDSGKFTIDNNKLSFQSFGLHLSDSTVQKIQNLDTINFLYQSDKILYIRNIRPLNKPSYLDTILIGQKKI